MRGIVSSGHPRVSEAAADILRADGNAFDAAVAAGFASTVAEPLLSSLGGGGFLLAHTGVGEEVLFDFFADTPGLGARALTPYQSVDFYPVTILFAGDVPQVFNVGMGAAAVPGMLKGLVHVHRRLGRLPLRDVVAPAAALARTGVEINGFQAGLADLLGPILRTSDVALRYHADPSGALLGVGDRLALPELASFLDSLPGDPEGFYAGDLAEAVVGDMTEGRGLITREDLRRYRVIERTPLSFRYRGVRVVTNPPPSSGGALLSLALTLQEAADLTRESWGSRKHVGTLAAVLRQVDRLRARPGPLPVPSDAPYQEALEVVRRSSGGTTHLNVADAEGNVASLTASNGEGSGYYVPGTGVMLNNMLGEDDLHPEGFHRDEPGLRISSMMAPTVLLDDDGIVAALGSGGSKRIRTALHQVVTNLVDFRLPLDAAVNLPRLHLDEGDLHVEPGFPGEAVAELEAQGPVVRWSETSVYFGGAHTVAPEAGEGAGDRRRAGHSMVVE